ncbi:PASTA domain-containing protein [Micromonospora sp. NPDC003197]
MTNGSDRFDGTPGGQSAGSGRMSLVAGSVVAIVLFATVGAVGGWLLAKSEQGDESPLAQATPTTAPSATSAAKTTQKPVKPTTKQTTPPAGQVVMPDLVGRNFKDARQELRDQGLKWVFRFGGAGQNNTIASTVPAAGESVRSGRIVQVFVIGEAPRVVVPNVVGLSCQQAAAKLVEAGLEPEYAKTDSGTVTKQKPEATAEKRWNDQVQIHCGQDGEESDDTPETPTP